jgi:fructokinase
MQSPEIITFGEALIDFCPEAPGENMVSTGKTLLSASGAPAIVAAALAKLGTPVGFIGRAGADFFGYHIRQVLDELKVDTSAMQFDSNANTGLAFVNWDEGGNAAYLFYRNPSADTRLQAREIDPAYLQQARVLHFGSLLLATEPSAEATRFVLEVARKAGLVLSYDLNLRLMGWPDKATALKGVTYPLQFANIVKLNRSELDFVTGEADPVKGSEKLWQENFDLLVVTLDQDGCYYRTAETSGYMPGFKVEAIDTIGAGDGFMAGLLDQLRRGNYNFKDEALVRQACLHGNAVGALVVTRSGAIPAMPSVEEVNELLNGN